MLRRERGVFSSPGGSVGLKLSPSVGIDGVVVSFSGGIDGIVVSSSGGGDGLSVVVDVVIVLASLSSLRKLLFVAAKRRKDCKHNSYDEILNWNLPKAIVDMKSANDSSPKNVNRLFKPIHAESEIN